MFESGVGEMAHFKVKKEKKEVSIILKGLQHQSGNKFQRFFFWIFKSKANCFSKNVVTNAKSL
jgi:hypothetical protein